MDISKLPDIDKHIHTLQFAIEAISVILHKAELNQIELRVLADTFDSVTCLAHTLIDERDRAMEREDNYVPTSTT